METKIIYVCKSCGSTNVQSKAWADLNADIFPEVEFIGIDDINNNWCGECSDHVLVQEKEEYEKDLEWIKKVKDDEKT